MTAPRISVLMPFHNGEAHLDESLESLRTQTFPDFEVLLIDDCSTDAGRAIALDACRSDSRFKLLVNDKRLGLAASLNRALDSGEGEFVARMDADDIALPQRFARQFSYLEAHPEIDMVGGWQQDFGDSAGTKRFPEHDVEIKALLCFQTAMSHPLFFFHRESWVRNALRYDPRYRVAQDRELLSRAAFCLRMANIPEVLLKYRVHKGQSSVQQSEERKGNTMRIALSYFRRRFPQADEGDLESFASITAARCCRNIEDFKHITDWMEAFSGYLCPGEAPSTFVQHAAARRLFVFCKANSALGLPAYRAFAASSFARYRPYSFFGIAKFFLKCLVQKG